MTMHDTEIAVTVRSTGWAGETWQPAALCRRAAAAALAAAGSDQPAAELSVVELSVVLADDAEVRGLNAAYRRIDRPTNVLSFPQSDAVDTVPGQEIRLLGDVILARETICREADAAGKPVDAHVAHLVVHGVLHLLGYDHEQADAAADMQQLETHILAGLGFADPYQDFEGSG